MAEELLREYIAQEPRDRHRAERDTRERPWVLLQVAAVRGEDGAVEMASPQLISALAQGCLDLDTAPQVAVGLQGGSESDTLAALETACAPLGVPVHRVLTGKNVSLDGIEATRFDYVIVIGLGAPAPSLIRQTTGLLPPATGETLMEVLERSWADPTWDAATRPLSNWLPDLWGPALNREVAGARLGDATLDVEAGFRVDLWIADCPALGTLLACTDPVPMDRFLMDAHQVDPTSVPWFAAAQDADLPWITHEGAMLGGTLSSTVVDRPERTRARIPRDRPLTILGIASTTLANHSATLVRDGQVVAAVQEERLRRRKQLGWHPPGRPYTTVVSDPSIPIERPWPRRSIQTVLDMAGLTMDEVDIIALNGIPARYFPTYSLRDRHRPPVTIQDGRMVYIPHHLTHAASAYRVSGMGDDAVVFTVDGRGERETAAFFRTRDGVLERTFDILCNEDSLVGGVYEYITTILGFGHYGQGSTMGLAAMGDPGFDMSPFLSAKSRDDYAIHDQGIQEAWGHLSRDRDGPLEPEHITLAASIQAALEDTVIRLMEDGLEGQTARNICLAGGVALNCAMNQRIRLHFGAEEIFVQPGAHDAGTSLGAAMEAHFLLTGEAVPTTMTHAALGPSYTDEEITGALGRFGLSSTRPTDIARDVAELVAGGRVVCWFQGGMEFGPRALGGRSVLSDPRDVTMKSRVNRMKGRQWWRPFGPSILAGREADWFESPMTSPFMLFTLPVRPDRQGEIPAVVHVDGTSRPQSVNAKDQPRYHAMISAFEELTGVPMVTNTSFNTSFEPIVCSPEDAISSFLQLGADYLAIGDHLMERAALDPRRLRGI